MRANLITKTTLATNCDVVNAPEEKGRKAG